ncbi:ABC transporter permease [Rhodovulum sp. DZ06]|uniref:ABC transporter permease n=1 Tax=Rhodovulum sp. DZ06 TaxID=3425126 RepID=UPI003D34A0EE
MSRPAAKGAGFGVALKIARRELRGGIRGFYVFLACLALGVAAISAVGSVRMAISEGLAREGQAILGGDAEISITYRFAEEDERAWMEARAIAVSEIADFRSMAAARDPQTDELDRALTQVKGVDSAYPLYGELRLSDGIGVAEALERRDGRYGAVMEMVLAERLGLSPGDTFQLGAGTYELRALIEGEPDKAAGGFGFGPRTILLREGLTESGLLAPGTLFDSRYRLKLPEGADLEALKAEMQADHPAAGMRWRDRRNGAPGVQRFVDRIGAFLVLVGLAALAMGGVGVSAAVRSYLDGKTTTIATLKTLGAEGRTIFAVYLVQVGALAALGVGIGLALGAGLPALVGPLMEDMLPVPALFDIYARPLAEAATYGILTALIFALWPLAQARELRAARLFRDIAGSERQLPQPGYIALIFVLTVALIGAAVAFSGLWQLALGFAFGVLGALAVLRVAAFLVSRLARRAARAKAVRGRPVLRLALGAVGGPGAETAGVVLSLGLGLSVLAAVGQIDRNLRDVIERELPARAPAFFFVDIQNNQLETFLSRAEGVEGVGDIATAPMLRGVITRLNGVPAEEAEIDPAAAWVLRGDRGVTYSQTPPDGTVVTEGEWWPEDYSGPPLVSFAEEEGRELGLSIGDTVTVSILGRELTATVASFRVVEFRDMGINFLMVWSPSSLAGAPHSHIATVHATPEAEGPLLRAVAGRLPNVTAIRVRDAVEQVSSALSDLAMATRWGASVTLLTGIVVLIGAAAAGERRRVHEAAVLKTLGMTRPAILRSFALRSALLGAAAGGVAIVAGALAGQAVIEEVMEAQYVFVPGPAILIVVGGALAALLAGLGFAWRPLSARPAQVLRARE